MLIEYLSLLVLRFFILLPSTGRWRKDSFDHFQQSQKSGPGIDKFPEKVLHWGKINQTLSYLTTHFKNFQLVSEKMTILASAELVNTDHLSFLNLISFYFLAEIHRNYLQWWYGTFTIVFFCSNSPFLTIFQLVFRISPLQICSWSKWGHFFLHPKSMWRQETWSMHLWAELVTVDSKLTFTSLQNGVAQQWFFPPYLPIYQDDTYPWQLNDQAWPWICE